MIQKSEDSWSKKLFNISPFQPLVEQWIIPIYLHIIFYNSSLYQITRIQMAVHPKKPYQLFHYSHGEEWKTFQKRSSIRWRITASTTTSIHLHPHPPDKITPKTRKYYNNLRAGTIRSYVLPRVCTQFTHSISEEAKEGPKRARRASAGLPRTYEYK